MGKNVIFWEILQRLLKYFICSKIEELNYIVLLQKWI